MEKCCDLHTHSCYSDGTLTPQELIKMASYARLGAVALTDHNAVDGLPEFLLAASEYGIEGIPGVEFSTDYDGTELHMLGLFLKSEHFGTIGEWTGDYLRRRVDANIQLMQALNGEGYELDFEELRHITPNGYLNRAHIASELTRRGYTSSAREAFETLLNPKYGYYHPAERPDIFDTIRRIKSIGAVAVLAHPFLNLQEDQLRAFLPDAVDAGLDGMETLYPSYDERTGAIAGKIAQEFGVLPSGGSDYHGTPKPDIRLGAGKGNLWVPIDIMERLRERSF